MYKSSTILAVIFLAIVGCSLKKKVKSKKVNPEILLESIFTRFPGSLFYSKEKLVMIDPFGKPNFIQAFDSNNGKLLGTTGSLGEGPQEFITPNGIQFKDNSFFIYDPNLRSIGLFDIGKVNGKESLALKDKQKKDLFEGMVELLRIDDFNYIGITYENNPFTTINLSSTETERRNFGNYPISEKSGNTREVFQGTVKFNSDRDVLAYATYSTKYLSVYSVKKDLKKPTLLWEKNMVEPKFKIKDNTLQWEKDQESGFSDLCFTKDYILVSFKEGLGLKDKKGRGTELIPQSIYVYDYNGNLVKHLVSDIPVLRLSDNLESNIVFAIGVTPEFCLMKFNIDDV